MTTLLETLQKDQLTARKAKDAVSASLLTVIYSEAVNVGKNQGNRLTTDDEVIAVIKKMVKSSEQNIEIYTKADKKEALELTQKELNILSQYLPKAPSMEEVKSRVEAMIKTNNWAKESATMGKVMKELKVQYGSTLNGATTSRLLKELLSA